MSKTSLDIRSIPEHVPLDRVVDFDFYKVPENKDFHSAIMTMMESAPSIFYTPRNGGHWVVGGYQELYDIVRDPETFSSKRTLLPALDPDKEPTLVPLNMDAPEHEAFRQPLVRAFSAGKMMKVEGEIRALAAELIDSIPKTGPCEFVSAVAGPLPVTIFLKLIDMPAERGTEYCNWIFTMQQASDPELKAAAYRKTMDEMAAVVREKEKNPGNDVISELLTADVGGRQPTFEEMCNYSIQLFMAGLETVTGAMSYGIRHLAGDPALQAQLRENPKLIPNVSEELLRRYAFAMPGRRVAKNTTYAGVDMREGDRILLLIPGANLDAKAFGCPAHVDPKREGNGKSHMSFIAGPHRCLGMHLARIELKALYEEWLAKVPHFRLDEREPVGLVGGHVLGITKLPLILGEA